MIKKKKKKSNGVVHITKFKMTFWADLGNTFDLSVILQTQ